MSSSLRLGFGQSQAERTGIFVSTSVFGHQVGKTGFVYVEICVRKSVERRKSSIRGAALVNVFGGLYRFDSTVSGTLPKGCRRSLLPASW